MSDELQSKSPQPKPSLGQEVGAQAARKLKAQRTAAPGIWFGLGMMGLIGCLRSIPPPLTSP